MGGDVDGAQLGYVIGAVEGLAFTHCDTVTGLLGFGLEHRFRSAALSGAIGERHHAGYRQSMPVLHCGVAHIAEPGFATSSFAVKPTVRIGCARMGVILALLAMEVGAT